MPNESVHIRELYEKAASDEMRKELRKNLTNTTKDSNIEMSINTDIYSVPILPVKEKDQTFKVVLQCDNIS